MGFTFQNQKHAYMLLCGIILVYCDRFKIFQHNYVHVSFQYIFI